MCCVLGWSGTWSWMMTRMPRPPAMWSPTHRLTSSSTPLTRSMSSYHTHPSTGWLPPPPLWQGLCLHTILTLAPADCNLYPTNNVYVFIPYSPYIIPADFLLHPLTCSPYSEPCDTTVIEHYTLQLQKHYTVQFAQITTAIKYSNKRCLIILT